MTSRAFPDAVGSDAVASQTFDPEDYSDLRSRYLLPRVREDVELASGMRIRRQTAAPILDQDRSGYKRLRRRIRDLEREDNQREIYRLLRQLRDWEIHGGAMPESMWDETDGPVRGGEVVEMVDMTKEEETIDVDTYITDVLLNSGDGGGDNSCQGTLDDSARDILPDPVGSSARFDGDAKIDEVDMVDLLKYPEDHKEKRQKIRAWTNEEDEKLCSAVANFGTDDGIDWAGVTDELQGRSRLQCLQRYERLRNVSMVPIRTRTRHDSSHYLSSIKPIPLIQRNVVVKKEESNSASNTFLSDDGNILKNNINAPTSMSQATMAASDTIAGATSCPSVSEIASDTTADATSCPSVAITTSDTATDATSCPSVSMTTSDTTIDASIPSVAKMEANQDISVAVVRDDISKKSFLPSNVDASSFSCISSVTEEQAYHDYSGGPDTSTSQSAAAKTTDTSPVATEEAASDTTADSTSCPKVVKEEANQDLSVAIVRDDISNETVLASSMDASSFSHISSVTEGQAYQDYSGAPIPPSTSQSGVAKVTDTSPVATKEAASDTTADSTSCPKVVKEEANQDLSVAIVRDDISNETVLASSMDASSFSHISSVTEGQAYQDYSGAPIPPSTSQSGVVKVTDTTPVATKQETYQDVSDKPAPVEVDKIEDSAALKAAWNKQSNLRHKGEWKPSGGWICPLWANTVATTTITKAENGESSGEKSSPPVKRRKTTKASCGKALLLRAAFLLADSLPVEEQSRIPTPKSALCELRWNTYTSVTEKILEQTHAALQSFLPAGDCDSLEVVKLARSYYDYWRPSNIKVILLAESHSFTETTRALSAGLNPELLNNYTGPRNFIQLVYCLAYGENGALKANADAGPNAGTSQFWTLFAACSRGTEYIPEQVAKGLLGKSKHPFAVDVLKAGGLPVEERLKAKLSILQDLKDRGIWLLDVSVTGWYITQPQKFRRSKKTNEVHRMAKERPPKEMKAPSMILSWEMYTKHLIREVAEGGGLRLLVSIGKEMEGMLSRHRIEEAVTPANWDTSTAPSGPPCVLESIPAPNAWIPGGYGPFYKKLADMVNEVAPPLHLTCSV